MSFDLNSKDALPKTEELEEAASDLHSGQGSAPVVEILCIPPEDGANPQAAENISAGRSRGASATSVQTTPSNLSVLAALARLRRARSASKPTAMVGFKEWIFSHKSGALGSFAAAAEYVFASVLQMDMSGGNVRLHYGHPDVFDKLHCITRVRFVHQASLWWGYG